MSRDRSPSPIRWSGALPLELYDHQIWAPFVPDLYAIPGPVHGGIPGGSILTLKEGTESEFYAFQISNTQLKSGLLRKYFVKADYDGSLEKARAAALQYRIDFSWKQNLWKNQRRVIAPNVTEIFLTLGQSTIVDSDQVDKIRAKLWHAANSNHSKRNPRMHAKNLDEFMENVIFGPHPYEVLKHINNNPLDNRLSNLAPSTKAEIRKKDIRNSTGRVGVCRAHLKDQYYFVASWKEKGRAKTGKRQYYKNGDSQSENDAFLRACREREVFEAHRDLIVPE
jgi:hypothetical protein